MNVSALKKLLNWQNVLQYTKSAALLLRSSLRLVQILSNTMGSISIQLMNLNSLLKLLSIVCEIL